MAGIVQRKRGDGAVAFRAVIRIKRKRGIIHQESLTFDRLALAKIWRAKRRQELEEEASFSGG